MLENRYFGNPGRTAPAQLSELLLELSANLAKSDPVNPDGDITRILRILGEFMNFDWTTLLLFRDKSKTSDKVYGVKILLYLKLCSLNIFRHIICIQLT
jgi:hypothetical protein